MNDFKGTKGKWEYRVNHRGSTKNSLIQVVIPQGNLGLTLNIGSIGSDDCTVASCCHIEEHANALLISKAPEMLEMLIKLRGILTAHTPESVFDGLDHLIKEATKL